MTDYKKLKKIGDLVIAIGTLLGAGVKLAAQIMNLKVNGEEVTVQAVASGVLEDIVEEE